MQGCATAFQPAIWQEPWWATVDFLAFRVFTTPALILATCPRRIAHNHEAIFALIWDNRLIGYCCEHSLTIYRTVWDRALNWHTRRQLWWGPCTVTLAITGVFANQLEPGNTLVDDLGIIFPFYLSPGGKSFIINIIWKNHFFLTPYFLQLL